MATVVLFKEEFEALVECEGLLRTVASRCWKDIPDDLLGQISKAIEKRNQQTEDQYLES
jgi:hypothetical protein